MTPSFKHKKVRYFNKTYNKKFKEKKEREKRKLEDGVFVANGDGIGDSYRSIEVGSQIQRF
jgi:hypothetical protein